MADEEDPDRRAGGKFATVITYASIIIFVVIVFSIISAIWSDGYTIRSIESPEELNKVGFGGQALASLIRDRTATLASKSRAATGPGLKFRIAEPGTNDLNLKIAGTDLPIRAVATQIVRQLGLSPPQIAGTLWRVTPSISIDKMTSVSPINIQYNQQYHLALRDGDGGAKPLLEAQGTVDDLVDQAAVAVLGLVDPTSAANLLRFGDHDTQLIALSMAQEGLKRARRHDKSAWFRFRSTLPVGRPHAEKPAALVALASVLSGLGHYQLALDTFDLAKAAYSADGDLRADDYAADGRGYASIQKAERDNSVQDFEKDLKIAEGYLSGHNYDSSLFHLAEVRKIRFERALSDDGCRALPFFGAASDAFVEFERQHSDFTIAWQMHADMVKRLSGFLQFEGSRSSDCEGRDRYGNIAALHSKADELFQVALSLEPTNANTWLQWGILTHERQVPTKEWDPQLSNSQRAALTDAALMRMLRAAQLDPKSAFIDRRIGDEVQARLALSTDSVDEKERKDNIRQLGETAACRGLHLPFDDSRMDLIRLSSVLAIRPTEPCADTVP